MVFGHPALDAKRSTAGALELQVGLVFAQLALRHDTLFSSREEIPF